MEPRPGTENLSHYFKKQKNLIIAQSEAHAECRFAERVKAGKFYTFFFKIILRKRQSRRKQCEEQTNNHLKKHLEMM